MTDYEVLAGDDDTTLGAFATEILGDDSMMGKNLAEMDGDVTPIGEFLSEGDDEAGAWLHRLNPAYWLKSNRERKMIDTERQAWIDNAEANKRKAKQEQELAAAQKALVAKQAAQASSSESQAIEQQMQDIEQSLTSGAFVGGEADALGAFVGQAKEKAGKNKKICSALASKIDSGQKLSPEEMKLLRHCLKTTDDLRKIHQRLHAIKAPGVKPLAASSSGYHDENGDNKNDFLGAFATEILGNGVFSGSFVGGRTYPKDKWMQMSALAAVEPKKLPGFMKKNGIVLDRVQQGHLKQLTTLTRKALVVQMKKSPAAKAAGIGADDLEGDFVGSFGSFMKKLGKVAAVAALPAAGVAWLAYKGGKGVVHLFRKKKVSPAQARAARLAALQKRQAAAQARIDAANATTSAARLEAQTRAAALDAEAQAKDAEAQASQADTSSQQDANFTPPDDGSAAPDDGGDGGDGGDGSDDSGSFVGGWEESGEVETMGADDFSGAFVGAIDDPQAKKIVTAAASNTPLGTKIRAGASVYKAAAKGDPKAQKAIKKVQAKAAAGHPQAKRDLNAIKAGKVALHAKARAKTKLSVRALHPSRGHQKGVAVRNKLETAAAAKLSRMSHKRQLNKAAKVEKLAAAGHPKAKKIVAHVVKKAKAGDPKAKATVKAMQLSRHVRTTVKTPAEAKRVRQAQLVLRHAKAGNKKAVRHVRLIHAAAKAGDPNAKRAHARLKLAAHIETATDQGKVTLPPAKPSVAEVKQAHVQVRKKYVAQRQAGNVSREEALAAAKSAHALGLKERSAQFALDARSLRPAKQDIKNAAITAAAAQEGDPAAKAHIDATLAQAKTGDPDAIKNAGNLAAAQSLDNIQKGKPMAPQIAEATKIVERQQAGDPEAERTIQRAAEAAHTGHPKGVEAAVALSAAATVLAATAAAPLARKQWSEHAAKAVHGPKPGTPGASEQAEFNLLYAKVQNGTATREEAERCRQLAGQLRKSPAVVANISTLMPSPSTMDAMSSLPDQPLAPIQGRGSLVKEALRALFFATPDPLANYREGVQSRGAAPMLPPVSSGRDD